MQTQYHTTSLPDDAVQLFEPVIRACTLSGHYWLAGALSLLMVRRAHCKRASAEACASPGLARCPQTRAGQHQENRPLLALGYANSANAALELQVGPVVLRGFAVARRLTAASPLSGPRCP